MVLRRVSRRLIYADSDKDASTQLFSSISGEDVADNGDEDFMTADSLVTDRKRKCACPGQLLVRKTRNKKGRQHNHAKSKSTEKLKRWARDRYERAEQAMLEIMKAKGAVFGKPIARPALRSAARKCIGDTGLLDHLLKHMEGKVAPGGAERFRRCYSPTGVMEYWLERADLVDLRHEAGVEDPYWTPPPSWKPGDNPYENFVYFKDLKLLEAEMRKMKRDVDELMSMKQGSHQANMAPNFSLVNMNLRLDDLPQLSLQALFTLKAKTEKQLVEISNSLSSLQDMYKNFGKWKDTIEHQLREISDKLSSTKQNGFEPWLESSDLINFKQDDIPWLDSAELNIRGDVFTPWWESDDLAKVEPVLAQNSGTGRSKLDTVQNPCIVKIKDEAARNPSMAKVEQGIVQNPCVVKMEDEVMQDMRNKTLQDSCIVKIEDVQNPCMVKVEDEAVPSAAINPFFMPLSESNSGHRPSKDLVYASEIGLLKNDLTKVKIVVEELVREKEVREKAIAAPKSSICNYSSLDFDNSLHLLQEMYEDSSKWKAKIEQQVTEISSSLGGIVA